MAVVHHTTLRPSKLELLATWLPSQPWYATTGHEPELARAGGFRLDDPGGAVGLEFMVVTDSSGAEPASYLVPLSYRGSPLDGAGAALIGEAEHGVLGRRWIYDGTRDPVLIEQLIALIQGTTQAQAQSVSNTPDPSVVTHLDGAGLDGAGLDSAGLDASELHIIRRLEPQQAPADLDAPDVRGYVQAGWTLPDGSTVRGSLVFVDALAGGEAQ
jgi:Maltokinase N-terminal cap domain